MKVYRESHEVFPRGTMIDARYEIRELLGQGGMGAVYRAVDMRVGQTVALKMLLSSSGDPRSKDERRKRFLREVLAINEVQHRNIVHIQEFGFHRDIPYLVMELLRGKDLGKVLQESDGPPSIEYVVDILLVVCAAIRACHKAGVIHRDLKPGNIMVFETDSGNGWDAKVVDFSISKAATDTDLTQEGNIVGTPRFLAPEQIAGKVGPESDQYAIGMLLYVCLTKRHPYEGLTGLPLIRAIEKGEFKNPRFHRPEIPEPLEDIVLKAMNVEPSKRHGSVFALGQRLWGFASTLGRDNWKKFYFDTPGNAEEWVGTADLSVSGIPLIRRMAEGSSLKLGTSTVSAHYQNATVIAGDLRTVDDPEAKLVPETVSMNVEMRTPPDWRWQSGSTKIDRSGEVGAAGGSGGLTPWRLLGLAGGIALLVVVAGILGATLARRHMPASVTDAPTSVATAPSAAAPSAAAAPPVAAPLASGPAAIAAAPPAGAVPAPVAARNDGASSTKAHRQHGRPRNSGEDAAGRWEKDANGIPIPPI